VEQSLKRGIIVEKSARSYIDQINGGDEGIVPILQGNRSLGKKSKANFNYVTMFPFYCPVLLMSMRA
jgi:hypothetical protein